ncbi:MAG: serine/threonine-protein kinase [Gammaproteobacteria bacterium]
MANGAGVQLDSSRNALSQGFSLHWYQIDKVIGDGGFGITYLAHDQNLGRPVAIKEYMPEDFAVRVEGNTVQPRAKDKQGLYEWGLDRFIFEARILAQFDHPNIIRVLSVFEENNTAYMVMEYARGRDLSKVFKTEGIFNQEQLLDVFIPIIDGLVLVHNEHFIHRDIKPANIYIDTNSKPVLLDFGSARQSFSGKTRPLTNVLTYGYAPYEQYSEDYGEQGPWTDIYSLGACFYIGLTGKKPVDALTRGGGLLKDGFDPYEPVSLLLKNRYPEYFLRAIDNALLFKAEHRPQDVLTWASMLLGETEAPPLPGNMGQHIGSYDDKTIPRPRRKNSFPTEPLRNSKGLINSSGKRNTNPTFDIQVSNGSQRKQQTQRASIPMIFVTLVLVVAAGALGVQMRVDLKIKHWVDRFYNNSEQTESIRDVALPSENKSVPDADNLAAEAADSGGSNSVTNDDTSVIGNQDTTIGADKRAETEGTIKKLLSNAGLAYKQENFTRPNKNNAVFYFKKVLTLDSSNAAALKGLQDVENRLTKRALETFNNKRFKVAKNLLNELEQLNSESKTVHELRSKIAEREKAKREIASLLNRAKMLRQKERYMTPENNNAYDIYQQVLEREPDNKDALQGVLSIKDYYIRLFGRHIKDLKTDKAKQDLKVLSELQIPQALYEDMESKFAAADWQAKKKAQDAETAQISKPAQITMDQVNELLGSFKTFMENQDFKELEKISRFSDGREQFIKQLFGQYKTVKVQISNVQYIAARNKASARIQLSELTENSGYQVVPGAWSRFQIDMRLDRDQRLKIHW